MSNNVPEMQEYQKAYIELISKKTADEAVKSLDRALPCAKHEERILEIEKKVFDGLGDRIDELGGQVSKLSNLWWKFAIVLASAITVAIVTNIFIGK